MNALGFNGDCFETAMYVAKETGGMVVHGLPIGRGPLNRGRRYWHAWCESNGLVLDFASGRSIRYPVAIYYRKGRLSEEHIYRYTLEEAIANATEDGSYGPWVEGYKEMEEV
jgi:hypothetical protein